MKNNKSIHERLAELGVFMEGIIEERKMTFEIRRPERKPIGKIIKQLTTKPFYRMNERW